MYTVVGLHFWASCSRPGDRLARFAETGHSAAGPTQPVTPSSSEPQPAAGSFSELPPSFNLMRISVLVERYDAVKLCIFQRNLSILEGLFSSVSKPIFATKYSFFKHFARSTRFAHLRTAPNSKSSQNFVKRFHIFVRILLLFVFLTKRNCAK